MRTTDADERLRERADRLDDHFDATGLEAVWFARPNGFAWLTGGDSVVDREEATGTAAAGYTADGEFLVVTESPHAERLADEELPAPVEVEQVPWYESSLTDAVAARSPTPAAADVDVPGFESIDATALRQPLSERDVERYRTLGREVAAAVETVSRELQSTDVEREVAAGLRISLATAGVDVPVCLVGGGQRAQAYPNPTPTDAELGDYAVVSVTGERAGLHASLTRTVAFDAPDWLGERHGAAARVETTALAATREAAVEGESTASVFSALRDAYAAVGHPEEWRQRPQGGAAGYAVREWVATPTATERIHAPMAYAWNPVVAGARSEDTVLVTADGFEVLTSTDRWPTSRVDAVDRDASIERPDVLRSE
jgi:Xaa-Pro aminopeptidase